jgi:hypothetical protein
MMRAEFTLAMRRESEEFERAMIEKRVDEAFEHVYEFLGPVTSQLRALLSDDDCRLLDQIEHGYLRAIEFAAKSGLGCQPVRRSDSVREQHAIPLAQLAPQLHAERPERAGNEGDPDQVINVRPWG